VVYSDSACFATTEGKEYFIHLSTTMMSEGPLENIMNEKETLPTGSCQLTTTTDPSMLSPGISDICDMAKTIVPSENNKELLSTSFAVSVSTDTIDLPICRRTSTEINGAETYRGILYNVVGTGVPLSVPVSYTTASPVAIWIYNRSRTDGRSSGCENKGRGLSYFEETTRNKPQVFTNQ
jgi:hypothetical protein